MPKPWSSNLIFLLHSWKPTLSSLPVQCYAVWFSTFFRYCFTLLVSFMKDIACMQKTRCTVWPIHTYKYMTTLMIQNFLLNALTKCAEKYCEGGNVRWTENPASVCIIHTWKSQPSIGHGGPTRAVFFELPFERPDPSACVQRLKTSYHLPFPPHVVAQW